MSAASLTLALDSLFAPALAELAAIVAIRAAIDSHSSEDVIAKAAASAEPSAIKAAKMASDGNATLIKANVASVVRLVELEHLQAGQAFDSYADKLVAVGHAANVPTRLAAVMAEVYIIAYTTGAVIRPEDSHSYR